MTFSSDMSIHEVPLSARTRENRLVVSGSFIRVARPPAEPFEPTDQPDILLEQARETEAAPDLVSFIERLSQPSPRFRYYHEADCVAVLEIETYDKWWKETVNDKTRNMVRKAGKKGVQVEVAPYTDELVHDIKAIYDECPVRQGKKSRHYRKSVEQIRAEHATFLDRSEFLVARLENRLIGFSKVVFGDDFASIMNFISLLSQRDKAPNNALLAKVIERCLARDIHLLHYGIWSRRGFGEFKVHNGFRCRQVPRYFVPLSTKGRLALQMGLHRPLSTRLPESWVDRLAALRMKWYAWRYPMK